MAKSLKLMPGPKAWPIVGSVMEYSKKGKYTFERLYIAKKERFKQFGKIHKEKIGPVTLVQVYDPSDIEAVFRADGKLPLRPPLPLIPVSAKRDGISLGLGSTNGEEWYNLRRAVQRPMMHPRAASVYLPAQNAVADDFLKLIDQLRNEHNEVENFYEIIYRYTMESIGTVCFNERLGCLKDKIEPGSETDRMITAVQEAFQALQKTSFAFPSYKIWRTPVYRQFVKAKKTMNEISYKHIQSAAKTNRCPIAELQKSHASGGNSSEGPNFLLTLIKTEGFDKNDVVGLVTDLFTAGIDSTANALSFVLYNLAKHPKAQDDLLQEIDRYMSDGQVVAEALDNMSYMKACVKESFRCNFPVEGGTTRILSKDLILSGYTIPKGTMIAMNNQTICQEQDYFDNPDDFFPERWMRSSSVESTVSAPARPPPNFAMLPFGHGF